MTGAGPQIPGVVRRYLDQTLHLVERVAASGQEARLLRLRLAPDMLDTADNLGLAMQFAARTLCQPAGGQAPDLPDAMDCVQLRHFGAQIGALIDPISAQDLKRAVSHVAGEAHLTQDPAEYVLAFGLPNMLFHLSMGYAGLRMGGLDVGKADFDGFHIYSR